MVGSEYTILHQFFKLGCTQQPVERMYQYNTGDPPEIGLEKQYIGIWEINVSHRKDMKIKESEMHLHFQTFRKKRGDSFTEWFSNITLEMVDNYITSQPFYARTISSNEIKNIHRLSQKEDRKTEWRVLNKEKEYTLYPVQEEMRQIAVQHFQTNNKAVLQLSCGIGKTRISLFVSKSLNPLSLLIGVPNRELLKQWDENVKKIFLNYYILIVNESSNVERVKTFLQKNEKVVVITTYHSSNKVKKACEELNYSFDMKINDEAHHLTSLSFSSSNRFVDILDVPSKRQLSLTATLKCIESDKEPALLVISNDDVDIFGEIVVRRDLLWAIQQNLVCDYVIQTIKTDDEKLEEIIRRYDSSIKDENDVRLFYASYLALRSITEGHSHHLLIYCNTCENAEKVDHYLDMMIGNENNEIYTSNYDGGMSSPVKSNVLLSFTESTYGILSCVYCLGEGWDLPLLDGVVFAENMTSPIRIVQSALRGCRKDPLNSMKQNKIILPMVYDGDWSDITSSDFQKVREVVTKMSKEDASISHKIRVSTIDVDTEKIKKVKEKEDMKNNDNFIDLGEYDEDLTNKLKIRTIQRSALGTSYREAKRIVKETGIKTKEEYTELCKKDIRLTEEPEEVYGKAFLGWLDYLGLMDMSKKYYTLMECCEKVQEWFEKWCKNNKKVTPPTRVMEELCKIDDRFPPVGLWVDYYKVNNISDIIKTNSAPVKKLKYDG
jgi:superfamily II DNA or RNA helicase